MPSHGKTAKCCQPFEVHCANIKSGVNFDVGSQLLQCMSRAILVGLNAQNDCLVASRFCCTVGGWVKGGYNSVQRYGTTTGNAYWALAMQKCRFVSMSLRGGEFVHQPNTIVGKCNTRLVLNSTSILNCLYTRIMLLIIYDTGSLKCGL